MKRPWLAPLVPLYAAGAALRDVRIRNGWEQVRRLAWPVISIGNLSTGGSGKTPLTIALARLLASKGVHVDVLSRGYGRDSSETARVRPDGTAAEFGDEPLLIAREAGVPVYVAQQRHNAGLLAEAESLERQDGGADRGSAAHILDDGFQHRQLARDVDILLLSESDLRDSLLPAGDLREKLDALQRATVLAVPADEPEVERYLREIIPIDRNSESPRWMGPIWRLRRRMDAPVAGGPVLAFCGIARPKQFFAGLEGGGVQISATVAFRDHHLYTTEDMDRLVKAAQSAGVSACVTTEKDLVRIGKLAGALPKEILLTTAKLTTEIEDANAAIDWLVERLVPRLSHQRL